MYWHLFQQKKILALQMEIVYTVQYEILEIQNWSFLKFEFMWTITVCLKSYESSSAKFNYEANYEN